MEWSESVEAVAAHADRLGLDLPTIRATDLVRLITDWYRHVRMTGVAAADEDGDMLLLQWGIPPWSTPPTFQIDVVRQYVIAGDDEIWQLSTTLHYPIDTATTALGSGHRWCATPDELPTFVAFLDGSAVLATLGAVAPERLDVALEPAD